MPGFYAGQPDPDRKPSPGELLDVRAEIDEQTFEALAAQAAEQGERIAALERAVGVLEALLLGCRDGQGERR
jgi:hypothetical protein